MEPCDTSTRARPRACRSVAPADRVAHSVVRRRPISRVTLIVALAVSVLVGGCGDDRIADGVRVGSVDVGGLHSKPARQRIQRGLAHAVRRPVAVTYRGQRFVLRPDLAGVRVDADASVKAAQDSDGGVVAPRVSYDHAKLDGFVARVATRVERPARDADIDIRDGKLQRTRARNGVKVKRPELVAALVRAMAAPAAARRKVKLPVTVVERADRTLVDLAKRYPVVIGIDRDSKTLRLYENLELKRRYKIAVGRQGLESSAGRYKIEEKVVNPPWHAPDKAWAGDLAGQTIPAGDPRNPLVARWMGYHDGEGIHGTKDLASLGTQASHGCIRMSPAAVKQLFARVKVGTPVFLQ
ncbi:MAG: L,D-transpeptidase ErfK/SrfK [bacterium]